MHRLSIRFLHVFDYIVPSINLCINYNSALRRFATLGVPLTISFLIIVGIPAFCYLWWLKSVHAINTFVKSFDPISGSAYNQQSIEGILWPTFVEYLTESLSSQFLLCLLLIQSMKPVAFYLFPAQIPKRVRLNIIIILFVIFFNIDSVDNLILILTLFFVVFAAASRARNVYYAKDLLCAVTVSQFMIQILNERHNMNTFYCEIVFYLMVSWPLVKRLSFFC
jgi:hypothetical protein